MKAIKDKLILKRKFEALKSAGGIITSTAEKPKTMPNQGIVVAMGPVASKVLPKALGKTVLFTNGVLTNLDGDEHVLVSVDDIYGVL